MNTTNNCDICKAYGWGKCIDAGNNDRQRNTGKRSADLHRTETAGRPTKQHRSVQTSSAVGKNPRADPTVLFHMMEFWEGEAEAWKKIARKNEIDNVKKDMQLEVLEAVNERHLRDLRNTMEVNEALWERNSHQYALLEAIGRQFPEVAAIYMPWVNANTQPNSPDVVDLTSEEEILL